MRRNRQAGVDSTALFLIAAPAFGATWSAKPTATAAGTGDCSSWANACTMPQAVAAATGTRSNPRTCPWILVPVHKYP